MKLRKREKFHKKEFKVGEIVACRQLQVSTGPNSSMKPKLTGPYAVIAINNEQCSCTIEDLNTGSQSKEHFTNLVLINYHPAFNRVHSNFDADIADMIERLRDNKLKIKASTRRLLQLPIIDEEDEVDEQEEVLEDPAINAAGPADARSITLPDSQQTHELDFGQLPDRGEEEEYETGRWQQWFDEQIALMSDEEDNDDPDGHDDDEVSEAEDDAEAESDAEAENDADDRANSQLSRT